MKKSTTKAIKRGINKVALKNGLKPNKTMHRKAKKFYLNSDEETRSKMRG